MLLKTLLTLESLDEPSHAKLTGLLDGIHQRERRAPRTLWLELSRQVLARAAAHLRALSGSNAEGTGNASADLLRRLLWRMAHPESGDRAQALEDQFELLAHLAATFPSEQRADFLCALDGACARQIRNALEPKGPGAQPRLPMAALAMRGAIAVLRTEPGRIPRRPVALGHAVADAGMRFFMDWFHAKRVPCDQSLAPVDTDCNMIRLLLRAELLSLRDDPLSQELHDLAEGLMRLQGPQ